MQNVANETINTGVDLTHFQIPDLKFFDLFSGQELAASGKKLLIKVPPYGVFWLRPQLD